MNQLTICPLSPVTGCDKAKRGSIGLLATWREVQFY